MNEKNVGKCSTIGTCSTMGSSTQFRQMKCPQRFNDLHETKSIFLENNRKSLVQKSRHNTHM
jgi:hypothetical protein